MSPDRGEGPPTSEVPAPEGTGTHHDHHVDSAQSIGSRQVSWWSVHEYVEPLLVEAGSWPMVGTAAWCDLADDDPVKLAAIFDAAQHWALRIETSQAAMAEASRNVSTAADWSYIAQQLRDRAEFEREHPWAKRRVAS